MRITFMQSGGFAGTIRGCVLDSGTLAPHEREELESLVAACGDADGTVSVSGVARDLRQYDIVIERDGIPRRIRCEERSLPEAARPLVTFLSARARPQPPGFADAFGQSPADG